MLETRYQDRPVAIEREKRHAQWAANIIKHSGMPPDSCALYIELLDLPPTFEINQRYVVNRGRYGGEKRVRRMFKDLLASGRVRQRQLRTRDGEFIPGIYEISDEPKWLNERACGAVDNLETDERFENIEVAQIAEGKTPDRRADDRRVVIDNSIINPDTDTSRSDVEKPVAPQLKAESRDRGSNAFPTGQAERRAGGAKAGLPQKEPGKSPAKGSALKGPACGEGDRTAKDRYTERLIDQLIDAASFSGSRMPNPRKAARAMASLIQWRAEELDFGLDVLPTIADVCSRVGDPDKPIVSWQYFTGAIRDAHNRRTRPVSAPTPRPPRRQLKGWTQAGSTLLNRRR